MPVIGLRDKKNILQTFLVIQTLALISQIHEYVKQCKLEHVRNTNTYRILWKY